MPLSDVQRNNIVEVAKSWLGTPYRGWSAIKGSKGGVDCGQLLKAVYLEAGHRPGDGVPLPTDYSLQVCQHREDPEYINTVMRYMREISELEAKPGDTVVYKLDHAFAHAGIIVSWPDYIIHAIGRHGVIGGHGTKEPRFQKCQRKFFTPLDEHCKEEE